MRTFLTVVLLAISFASIGQKNNKEYAKQSDWIAENLKGKIKSITQEKYDGAEKFGEVVKDKKVLKEVFEYNRQGFLTETLTTLPNSKTQFNERKFTYDNKMNIIEDKLNESGKKSITESIYNKAGHHIENNLLDAKGKLTFKYKYTLDANGNRIKSIKYTGDGSLDQTRVFTFENGNCVKEQVFDKNDKLTFEYDYVYNEINLVIKETFKSLKSGALTVVSIENSIYNNEGLITSYTKITDGKKSTSTYEYNSQNDLIRLVTSGIEYTYTYVYDKYKNWISKQQMYVSNSKRVYVILERDIKYY